jgi:hypothetical protein
MATTTPNFGWQVPTSTDLVKDGAVAIETLGDAIDASLVDLKGGTTGQVLAKASGTDMDFSWVAQDDTNAIQNAIVDAKGDLIAATAADTPARLAVGTNGQFLTADSTAATGLAWTTASGGFPAWTSYTPTVVSTVGTITSYTSQGWYSQSGKTVVYQATVNITNAGTGSGTLVVNLPLSAQNRTSANWMGSAIEGQLTGYSGWASVNSGFSAVNLRAYNFTTFVATGAIIAFTVTYEVA